MEENKFIVNDKYRKNRLSFQETNVQAEVYIKGDNIITIYTNIHYPNAFANKVFRNNPNCEKIVFTESESGRTWSIKK